jgi:hypothetical protein
MPRNTLKIMIIALITLITIIITGSMVMAAPETQIAAVNGQAEVQIPADNNSSANGGAGNVVDSSGPLKYMITESIDGYLNNASTKMINGSLEFLGKTLFADKDFTKQPALVDTWNNNLKIAYGILFTFFMVGVASAPLREHLNLQLFSLREIMSRVIAASIAIYLSLDMFSYALEFSDGITKWILGQQITVNNINLLSSLAGGTFGPAGGAATGTNSIQGLSVLVFIGAVMAAILAVFYAVRDAALWYLIAYIPFFIAAWVIPQTEKYFKVVFGLIISLMLLKFLHAGILHSFTKMQVEGGNSEVFMSIGMLFMMYVIPGILLQLTLMTAVSSSTSKAGRMLSRLSSARTGPVKK